MQAKKILGCHSNLGHVAQAALKSLAAKQEDDEVDDQEENDDEPEDDELSEKQRRSLKYSKPEQLVALVKNLSIDNSTAYKAIMDWMNNAPHYVDWSEKSPEVKGAASRIQDSIREAIRAAVMDAGRLEFRFLSMFRVHMSQDLKKWIMSIDPKSLSFDVLRNICMVVTTGGGFVSIGVQKPLTQDDKEELLMRLHPAMIETLFTVRQRPGRRGPRAMPGAASLSGHKLLSPGYALLENIPCMGYETILQRGDQFFAVKNRLGSIRELIDGLRGAIAEAKSDKPSPTLLYRHFLLPKLQCSEQVLNMPTQERFLKLKELPDNATIGNLVPGGDQEVQAILDQSISEGKLIWEMPKAPAASEPV